MLTDKFIIVIHVDNENTGLETLVAVEQNIYIEPTEYIIQGIIFFNFKSVPAYFLKPNNTNNGENNSTYCLVS